MTEAQAWIAENTGLLVGIIVVVALIYFAILYFHIRMVLALVRQAA